MNDERRNKKISMFSHFSAYYLGWVGYGGSQGSSACLTAEEVVMAATPQTWKVFCSTVARGEAQGERT